ncbi:hypothetical protein EJB05_15206, partial [Eragrostis curvula]
MRSSVDCESNCAPPLRRSCPGVPEPAAVAEEKPPLVQKIEAVAAGVEDEEGCKEVPVAPKSSLKRSDCVDSRNVVKGHVKWMDLLGKDLTQVKEFEPRPL